MLSVVKAICGSLLFIVTMVFGMLPYAISRFLKKRKISETRYDRVIGYLNSFAGGVFLGTSLLHLLPEAEEEFRQTVNSEYPIAGACTVTGILLVMFIEHIMGTFSHSDVDIHQLQGVFLVDYSKETGSISVSNSQSLQNTQELQSREELKNRQELKNTPDYTNKKDHQGTITSTAKKTRRIINFRFLIVIMALSLHIIFEGIVVGTQNVETDAWLLLGILSLHKCIVAFSVGLQVQTNLVTFKKVFLAMLAFSIIAPLGVGIGILVTEFGTGNAHGIAAGVLQSMGTGTFLYVTFFEMLQKELHAGNSIPKVACVTVGFLVIVGVEFLPDMD